MNPPLGPVHTNPDIFVIAYFLFYTNGSPVHTNPLNPLIHPRPILGKTFAVRGLNERNYRVNPTRNTKV